MFFLRHSSSYVFITLTPTSGAESAVASGPTAITRKRAKATSLTTLTTSLAMNLTMTTPPELPPHNKKLKRDAQSQPCD